MRREYEEIRKIAQQAANNLIVEAEGLLAQPEYSSDKRKVSENLGYIVHELFQQLDERGYSDFRYHLLELEGFDDFV